MEYPVFLSLLSFVCPQELCLIGALRLYRYPHRAAKIPDYGWNISHDIAHVLQ